MVELAVLVSILGWGVAGVFAGRASKIDSPISISAWAPFIALPLLVIPIIAGVDYSPSQGLLLAAICSAVTLFCAWVLYFFALKEEDASPVVTIGSTYPIFSFIIFVLIGSSQVRVSVIVGMILVVLGLALTQFISSNNGGISKKNTSSFSWLCFLLGNLGFY